MPFKWWEGLHALVTLAAIPVGTTVPAGFNRARQVSGERQDTWPSRLRLRQFTYTIFKHADRDNNKN